METTPKITDSNEWIRIDDRGKHLYPFVFRFLSYKVDGGNVGDFFYKRGISKIALYAQTDIMRLVAKELCHYDKPIDFVVVDKNAQHIFETFDGRPVEDIDSLLERYRSGDVEKIVICSLFHSVAIFDELMERGVKLNDIISINDVIP